MSDFNKSSLSEIANLIKSKKVSSSEVTSHYIKNIEKGKKLNSFITTCFEEAVKSKEFDNKKNFNGLIQEYLWLLKIYFVQKM